MRFLFLSAAILYGLISGAQNIEVERSPDTFDKVDTEISSNLNSREKIYEASKSWFDFYFKKNKDTKLHTEDKEGFTLKSSPSVHVQVNNIGQNTYAGSINYDLEIKVIDDSKCEVSMSNFEHESSRSAFGSGGDMEFDNPECGLEELPAGIWIQIKDEAFVHMKETLNSLSSSLNDQ